MEMQQPKKRHNDVSEVKNTNISITDETPYSHENGKIDIKMSADRKKRPLLKNYGLIALVFGCILLFGGIIYYLLYPCESTEVPFSNVTNTVTDTTDYADTNYTTNATESIVPTAPPKTKIDDDFSSLTIPYDTTTVLIIPQSSSDVSTNEEERGTTTTKTDQDFSFSSSPDTETSTEPVLNVTVTPTPVSESTDDWPPFPDQVYDDTTTKRYDDEYDQGSGYNSFLTNIGSGSHGYYDDEDY